MSYQAQLQYISLLSSLKKYLYWSQPDLWNDHLPVITKENLSLISLCDRVVYKVERS
jgi:hypothetical protein